MTDNPYQPPTSELDKTADESTHPQLRKSSTLVLALGWNVPFIVGMLFSDFGKVSQSTSNLMIAGWTLVIPIFVLSVEYIPAVQSWLFQSPLPKSMRSTRLAAWGFAVFWSSLSGWFIYATLTNG